MIIAINFFIYDSYVSLCQWTQTTVAHFLLNGRSSAYVLFLVQDFIFSCLLLDLTITLWVNIVTKCKQTFNLNHPEHILNMYSWKSQSSILGTFRIMNHDLLTVAFIIHDVFLRNCVWCLQIKRVHHCTIHLISSCWIICANEI